VSDVDWIPAVSILAAGLVLGALVLWRVVLKSAAPAPGTRSAAPPLELRDLDGKYQALVAQLRELDDTAGKRTPEQIARERHTLEHEAARVLRDADRLAETAPPPRKAKKGAPEQTATAPVPAPASALRGFLWGVGSVGALGLLFYLVSQSAKQRSPGASATGNTDAVGAAAQPDDAEVAQARASVERNPDDVDARLELVRLSLIRQDMMAVFKETQAVLQRSPGNPRALSYQALVRLAMGQSQQAESMLKEALQKDPKLLDGYIHLMLVYVRSGRPAEADKVLADVSRRFPDRAESLKGLLAEMSSRSADDASPADASAAAEDPHANVPIGQAPRAAAGAARAPGGSGSEKKIAGILELDQSLTGQSFSGAIVFVTLREGGFGAGPPLAAKRLAAGSFPMPFEIGAADSMSGETLPDDLLVEARIDADGDPMTRPPADPYGRADRVPAGTKNVKVVLKRKSS